MKRARDVLQSLSLYSRSFIFSSRSQRLFGSSAQGDADVIITGAGHNGLVAACLLAKQGLKVAVYEEKSAVGGACTTQYPFEKAPGLGQSTGAYLLGLMPPELLTILDLHLPLMKRDPHYFLPTTGDRYLLLGSDPDASKAQFLKFFSRQDWAAHTALQSELEAIRTDIAPAMMAQPTSIEAAAERYIRPELKEKFVAMCRGSVKSYLERFGFESGLLVAMYAATDGLLALQGGYDSPGGGMNFLTHNMCRLPGADGTWMLVKGGMGTVTQQISLKAQEAGATIRTATKIESILMESGEAKGVVTTEGREHRAKAVLVNADPFSLRDLLGGPTALPTELNTKLDGLKSLGFTMKVNLALNEFPKYTCLPEDVGQHRTTTHLLPDEGMALSMLNQAYEDSVAGRLPEFPIMQVYTQTAVDQSLRDSEGRHSTAIFVHYVPHTPAGSSWEAEEAAYVDHLLSVWERFAPGVKSLVQDHFTLTPPKVESHFGIKHGVIHHIDNSFGFEDRFPYSVLPGLYSCSAGCHPGGSVIGCAGHNSAALIIKHLGLKQWWKQPFA